MEDDFLNKLGPGAGEGAQVRGWFQNDSSILFTAYFISELMPLLI